MTLIFATLTWAAAASTPQEGTPAQRAQSGATSDGDIRADELDAVHEASEANGEFSVSATGPDAQARMEAAEREILNVEDDMVPVAREASSGLVIGWVRYDGYKDASSTSPIVDDSGETIGFWASGLGWISVEKATAPSFDLATARAARRRGQEGGETTADTYQAEVDKLREEVRG